MWFRPRSRLQRPTSFIVHCPIHGVGEPALSHETWIDLDHGRLWFPCVSLRDSKASVKTWMRLSPEALCAVLDAGVVGRRLAVPGELYEPKTGPRLRNEDLLALHNQLHDDRAVAAWFDGQEGLRR